MTHDAMRWIAIASMCLGLIGLGASSGLRWSTSQRMRLGVVAPVVLCLVAGFLLGLGFRTAQWLVPSPPAGVRLELDCATEPAQARPRTHDGERVL